MDSSSVELSDDSDGLGDCAGSGSCWGTKKGCSNWCGAIDVAAVSSEPVDQPAAAVGLIVAEVVVPSAVVLAELESGLEAAVEAAVEHAYCRTVIVGSS